MLGEFGGRGLQDFAQHARLEFHEHAIDRRTRPLPVVERNRIVAELDADLGQDAIGRILDADEVFLGHDVVGRNSAHDIGPAKTLGAMRALISTRQTPAPLAAFRGMGGGFGHVVSHPALRRRVIMKAIGCGRRCDA